MTKPTERMPAIFLAHGAPMLLDDAAWVGQLRTLLTSAKIPVADDPARGLDHGTYIPLMCMYPAADIPVLQISLPSMDPKTLFGVGAALQPLRDEGVLIVGSGFLTHNLRSFGLPTPAWASEFDAWTGDVLSGGDVDALLDYRKKAPGVREALPTHEHFVPVVVAAGAAGADAVRAAFPIQGFWDGSSFTKRSVQYG